MLVRDRIREIYDIIKKENIKVELLRMINKLEFIRNENRSYLNEERLRKIRVPIYIYLKELGDHSNIMCLFEEKNPALYDISTMINFKRKLDCREDIKREIARDRKIEIIDLMEIINRLKDIIINTNKEVLREYEVDLKEVIDDISEGKYSKDKVELKKLLINRIKNHNGLGVQKKAIFKIIEI